MRERERREREAAGCRERHGVQVAKVTKEGCGLDLVLFVWDAWEGVGRGTVAVEGGESARSQQQPQPLSSSGDLSVHACEVANPHERPPFDRSTLVGALYTYSSMYLQP
jgi:hypothetical protein